MSTDFSYGGKQNLASGPFKPSGKNVPLDARTRINTYSEKETIPNPFIGMIVTVLTDENNNNEMRDYKVKSLKANSAGIANMVIDEMIPYVDYLGAGNVSQDDINTAVNNYLTEHLVQSGATAEQVAQIQANKTAIGDSNSGLIKEVNDIKNTELQNLNTSIQSLVTLVGVDGTGLPSGDANIIASINRIDKKTTTGNGLTSEQAQQLQTAYEHSQTTHVQVSDIPTKTSQLTNDSNYATKGYVETKIYEASLGGASLPECFITITGGV